MVPGCRCKRCRAEHRAEHVWACKVTGAFFACLLSVYFVLRFFAR